MDLALLYNLSEVPVVKKKHCRVFEKAAWRKYRIKFNSFQRGIK